MFAILLPVLLVFLIIVLPIVFIELLECFQHPVLLVALFGIPHNHYLLLLREVHLRHLSVVQEDVSKVSAVRERRFLLEANEVLSEVVSLEEDGRVVLKV